MLKNIPHIYNNISSLVRGIFHSSFFSIQRLQLSAENVYTKQTFQRSIAKNSERACHERACFERRCRSLCHTNYDDGAHVCFEKQFLTNMDLKRLVLKCVHDLFYWYFSRHLFIHSFSVDLILHNASNNARWGCHVVCIHFSQPIALFLQFVWCIDETSIQFRHRIINFQTKCVSTDSIVNDIVYTAVSFNQYCCAMHEICLDTQLVVSRTLLATTNIADTWECFELVWCENFFFK